MSTDVGASLAVPGGAVEVAWWGARGGLTLVLLHEGLGRIALWRDFPAALAARTGCRVLAWSRPGYGGSAPVKLPRPLDYMERAAAGEVSAVLDAAGIGRCVLVGHSDGASIAALVRDARVVGGVLMAPHFFVEAMCLEAIRTAKAAFGEGGLRGRLARYHADVDGAFGGWCGAWLDPGFAAVFDIRAAARGVDGPVLQIQGDADPYGTLAQMEVLAAAETLVVPGGHAPHFEAREAVLGRIAGFVAGVEATARMRCV